jgi:FkbM family methyltransferase
MAKDNESILRNVQDGKFSFLSRLYRTYRQWRKNKHRKIKAEKQFLKMLDFYSKFVKEGDLCFDIGANVGNRTEVFHKLGATVVAVEPQQSCASILRKRFCNCANVHIVQKALDKATGQKDIFITSGSTLSSMSEDWIRNVQQSGRFKEQVWDKREVIETTTFDLLIKEFGRPAFCKIDVEGFEYNVLRGLSEPVKAMSFEFHPEYIQCAMNCIRYLSELGTTTYNYSEGESMSLSLLDWVKPDEITSILGSLRKSENIFGDIYVKFSDSI